MTREEVEERLEDYAAHKAVKEAHEDAEEPSLETGNEKLENEKGDGQDSTQDREDEANQKTSLGDDVSQDEIESQDEIIHSAAPSLNDCDLSALRYLHTHHNLNLHKHMNYLHLKGN